MACTMSLQSRESQIQSRMVRVHSREQPRRRRRLCVRAATNQRFRSESDGLSSQRVRLNKALWCDHSAVGGFASTMSCRSILI